MKIQLHGAYFHNAGDILMMQAAIGRLSGKYEIDVSSSRDTRPHVLMDVCGYWLGDPWMPKQPDAMSKAKRLADGVKKWKAGGTKIILMPQTFGPFTNPALREYARVIADHADLVCARDRTSLRHLEDLCGPRDTFRLYPDYTAELTTAQSDKFDVPPNAVAIIPNMRMIDRTPAETAGKYIDFLLRCIGNLKDRTFRVFLLPHEMHDRPLAQEIANRSQTHPLRICTETDPQAIRGIIRNCTAVVGSRYHGILGALYQGIPAIGTSWNHKFDDLFGEYGYTDMLVNPDDAPAKFDAALDRICDPSARMGISQKILAVAANQQQAVDRLWSDVHSVINGIRKIAT